MNPLPPPPPSQHGLSVHRIDALTDGIYAVAMTLLVIELKLPEHGAIHTPAEFNEAVLALLPRVYAWVISFFVMALFWMGHHRVTSHLRHVDGRLITLTIVQLAFISLMPFSSSLLGAPHAGLLAQVIFSSNMAALAAFAWLNLRHVHRHTELSTVPMTIGAYRGASIRVLGLIGVSVLAVLIRWGIDGGTAFGSIAFVLMGVIGPLSRRAERASGPAAPPPARH